MKKLKIYFIDNDYINYLRKYDDKVAYNKVPNRPYVGVVYTYNGFNYFAPLSSPKPKHIKLKNNAVDIFKIKNGKLGIININNMIPTPIEALTEALPTVTDREYKSLLIEQIDFINHNKEILYSKVNQFQKRYRNGYLENNILERCCNFKLLEEKCLEYSINKKERNLEKNIEDNFDELDV